ncbi:hypothetical protein AAE02nite_32520 [Adhaeribacter aerolatus]|uniref:Uncharacterized protein n=1 Tax=Adhaeribacter aerolatus TaxID=670289 RepID=A0A512B0V1_9BACT|nr:hypothetical protein AAE02nite_32520 [Adhaeribacter aerolatus]
MIKLKYTLCFIFLLTSGNLYAAADYGDVGLGLIYIFLLFIFFIFFTSILVFTSTLRFIKVINCNKKSPQFTLMGTIFYLCVLLLAIYPWIFIFSKSAKLFGGIGLAVFLANSFFYFQFKRQKEL